MIKIYGHEVSGNAYKVKLLAALLGIEYEWVRIDLMKGEHKSPEYLARNPFAQVPLHDNSIVTAILNYAQESHSDAIVLGTSRTGILEQVVKGNIPAAISQKSDRTVIIVRGT